MTPEPTEPISLAASPKRRSTGGTREVQREEPANTEAVDQEYSRPPGQPEPASRRAHVAVRFVTWVFSLVVSVFTGMVKGFRV